MGRKDELDEAVLDRHATLGNIATLQGTTLMMAFGVAAGVMEVIKSLPAEAFDRHAAARRLGELRDRDADETTEVKAFRTGVQLVLLALKQDPVKPPSPGKARAMLKVLNGGASARRSGQT